eukprot:SAG22_NODE_248_length_13909_cov_141.345112_10_plen_292_part_00
MSGEFQAAGARGRSRSTIVDRPARARARRATSGAAGPSPRGSQKRLPVAPGRSLGAWHMASTPRRAAGAAAPDGDDGGGGGALTKTQSQKLSLEFPYASIGAAEAREALNNVRGTPREKVEYARSRMAQEAQSLVKHIATNLSTLLKQLIEQFPTQDLTAQPQVMKNGATSTAFEQARPTHKVQEAVEKIEEKICLFYDAARLGSEARFADPLLDPLCKHTFDRRERRFKMLPDLDLLRAEVDGLLDSIEMHAKLDELGGWFGDAKQFEEGCTRSVEMYLRPAAGCTCAIS